MNDIKINTWDGYFQSQKYESMKQTTPHLSLFSSRKNKPNLTSFVTFF